MAAVLGFWARCVARRFRRPLDQQYNPNDPYVRALVAQIDQYTRHIRGSTMAFCDEHVKWYPWDAIWKSHPHNDRKKPWLNPYIVNSEP